MQNTYNFIYFIGFRCSGESKSRIQVLQTPKPPVIRKSLLEMSYLIKGPFPSRYGGPLVPRPYRQSQ